jgi:hypothetical protein
VGSIDRIPPRCRVFGNTTLLLFVTLLSYIFVYLSEIDAINVSDAYLCGVLTVGASSSEVDESSDDDEALFLSATK